MMTANPSGSSPDWATDGALQCGYDVAFSFLSQDEPLANDLASQLQGRAEVFIYSERQKEAAGTDGMDFYSTIFGAAAKVCVVLYRQRWGEILRRRR